jgi:hypothetical protein
VAGKGVEDDVNEVGAVDVLLLVFWMEVRRSCGVRMLTC